MSKAVSQGDILKIEGIRHPVLVTSKDFFNASGNIVGCPVIKEAKEGSLHIPVKTDQTEGIVFCEQMRYLELSSRRYTYKDRISMNDIVEVTDAIQSIFDYV